jgi:hypothetical protein
MIGATAAGDYHRGLGITFVKDYGMIVILLVLYPVHSLMVVCLWESISSSVLSFFAEGTLRASEDTRRTFFAHYNRLFNSRAINMVSFTMASGFTILMIVSGRNGIGWWGQLQYGTLGFLGFVYACLIIWYQLVLHNLKGIIAIVMMRNLFGSGRYEIHLNPFHRDHYYGLGNLERILLLVFATTIIHTTSVMIAISCGLFHRTLDPLLIAIVVIILVFVPVFIVYPVKFISMMVKQIKQKELDLIGRRLDAFYGQLMERIRSGQLEKMTGAEYRCTDLLISAYSAFSKIRSFPFSNKRLVFMSALYIGQVCIVGLKLYQLFHPSER